MTATISRTITDPQLSVNQGEFANAVATVARSLPSRPSAPILAGARLTVEGDQLTIAGFDYETSTQIVIPCDGRADGQTIVSGALLASIAKSLPNKPVTLDVAGNTATLKCGTSRFTLPTMPVEDYPQLPEHPEVSGTIDGADLAHAVDAVKTAIGNDDALPMLTGIHVTFEHGTMTLAATDRFRLATHTTTWQATGEPPAPILIPGKSLIEAVRNIGPGTITLAISDGTLGIQHTDTASTMRLLDAEYPKFQNLLPASHARVADVSVTELTQAVKRAALIAERGNQVRLTFDTGSLTVSSGDDGSASSETLDITLAGEPMTIAFNPAYLLDGLATINTESVLIGMGEPSRPAILAPCRDGTPAGNPGNYPPIYDTQAYLLMPVRMPS